jgi:HEAT repeats
MRWLHRKRLRLWQRALEQCKVTEVESSGFWAWRAALTARSGAIEMRVSSSSGGDDRVALEIAGPEIFSVLKLRRQILKLWTREIEVGDEAFDGAFLVDGPVRPVFALLDEKMRRLLLRASAACHSLEIGEGSLHADLSEAELPRLLPLLLDVSRQLAEPLDVEGRIVRNARRDPRPGVRLANLLLLVRERPGDPDTRKALLHACRDVSPRVRVRAGIELGDEGRDVLVRLAETSSDDEASAQAVAHLGGKLPFERAKNILARSLRKHFSRTAHACLEVLGRRRAAAVGTLSRVMTREGEIGAAAARALGMTGEKTAAAPLLQALRSQDGDLRRAAATALGQVGSVAAVAPLREAAERSWLDLGLRRAARQAIAEIQARLEGASPGQLSLAEDEAGQLSLAQAEVGQLSLAPAVRQV